MRNSTKDFWTSTQLFCNPSGKIPFRVTLDSNSHEYHATLVCQIELIGPIRQENLESHCARHLEVSSHVRSWKMCRNTSLWNSNSIQYLPEILKRIEQARATRIPIFLQSILIYIYMHERRSILSSNGHLLQSLRWQNYDVHRWPRLKLSCKLPTKILMCPIILDCKKSSLIFDFSNDTLFLRVTENMEWFPS